MAALALSGCSTNADVQLPMEREQQHQLSSLDTLSKALLNEQLPGKDWSQLPPEIQGSDLQKPTDVAKNSQGIISGKIINRNCIVLYLKDATPGTVGVAVGTHDEIKGTQEFILRGLTGPQARDYPEKHPPCT